MTNINYDLQPPLTSGYVIICIYMTVYFVVFCNHKHLKTSINTTTCSAASGNQFKVAQNSFQHLYWMGRYNHSLSLDATINVSKYCSIIGEYVVIIFLTQ